MKYAMTLAVALSLTACGKKSTPETPTPEPAPAPAAATPAPAPATAPEPAEPETPEVKASNADFMAAITHADGSVKKGRVRRVERGEDRYAEQGWTDKESKVTVTLEGGGTEIESPWGDVRKVDISYGSKSDIDCQYDSSFTPTMYMCVMRTTSKVETADGKSWDAGTRHKWKFEFADGSTEEFFISKLPHREQEKKVPALGTVTENTELYVKLQKELLTMIAGPAVTSIQITP